MTRTAVVTGHASGMGRATAALLVAEGWTVVGLDRAPLTEPLTGAGRLVEGEADVTDREAVGSALREALDPSAQVDLVATIAGIFPPSRLDTYTTDLFRRTFDVNVLGTLNTIVEARPYLRDGSAIVTFASVDAFTVSPGQLLYGASKAAVVMLTKSLALELAPAGIRVNGVAPGWVNTPGSAATGRMEQAAAGIPLGRVAQPEEIAAWVLRLSGDGVAFMTGETIVLSGGDVIR